MAKELCMDESASLQPVDSVIDDDASTECASSFP